ncbi:hypothetical protein VTK26DRAFT_15 [Humicola hyalothermophila]
MGNHRWANVGSIENVLVFSRCGFDALLLVAGEIAGCCGFSCVAGSNIDKFPASSFPLHLDRTTAAATFRSHFSPFIRHWKPGAQARPQPAAQHPLSRGTHLARWLFSIPDVGNPMQLLRQAASSSVLKSSWYRRARGASKCAFAPLSLPCSVKSLTPQLLETCRGSEF